MSELSHLLESIRPIAQAPDKGRIAFLQVDLWIDYPRAAAALHTLEELLSPPHRARMRVRNAVLRVALWCLSNPLAAAYVICFMSCPVAFERRFPIATYYGYSRLEGIRGLIQCFFC